MVELCMWRKGKAVFAEDRGAQVRECGWTERESVCESQNGQGRKGGGEWRFINTSCEQEKQNEGEGGK